MMKSNIITTPRNEAAKELSRFTCSECGTKCKIVKDDKDMWIEPVWEKK